MSALHAAFVTAQAEMPKLHKDSEADTGKFRYRYLSLEALLEQVLPVLNRHGLGLYQAPNESEGRLGLLSKIIHAEGEWFEAWTPLAVDAGASAQAQGSAITYARRYAVLSMLGLAPDEDDDGAKAEGSSRGEAGPTADAPAQASPSEDPSTFKAPPPATQKPVPAGVVDELKMVLKLLNSAFPEHPGENRKWEDVAKEHCCDTYQVESVIELSLAQANELVKWLEDEYQRVAREAAVPFG